MAINLRIDNTGEITGVYSDDLVGLLQHGDAGVTRASHVEPGRDDKGNPCWYADMSPSEGPTLGPFYTRAQALSEEVAWLHDKIFNER